MLEHQFDKQRADNDVRRQFRRRHDQGDEDDKFNEATNTFVSDIHDDLQKCTDAVKGAKGDEHESFSTHAKARTHCDNNIKRIRQENATFCDDVGVHSPQWHAAWSIKEPLWCVVPTHKDAQKLVR